MRKSIRRVIKDRVKKVGRFIRQMPKRIAEYVKLLNVYGRKLYEEIFHDGAIVIHAWVDAPNGTDFTPYNWGDDLNKYLFEASCTQKVLFIPHRLGANVTMKLPKHYLAIGSILNFYDLNHACIFGTGVMNPDDPIIGRPDEVLCVRGPKTRQYLLAQGVKCPECYGDPALLLPYVYTPSITEKKHFIVIPNEGTKDNNMALNDLQQFGCSIVRMNQYQRWTDIVDQIANSTLVISESLHGLIVAEAYGVPSVWVEFVEHPAYWSFKYEDFYESISKYGLTSLKLYERYDVEELFAQQKNWFQGKIDYSKLIKAFPFSNSVFYNEKEN